MAIAGEANQIFRPVTMFDHGSDGEVEFKDNDGKARGSQVERAPTVRYQASPGQRPGICIRKWQSPERAAQIVTPFQGSHCDGRTAQGAALGWLVAGPLALIAATVGEDELSGQQAIRWMNVTRYLKTWKDKKSRRIIFDGENLDMEAVWTVRDRFFPKGGGK